MVDSVDRRDGITYMTRKTFFASLFSAAAVPAVAMTGPPADRSAFPSRVHPSQIGAIESSAYQAALKLTVKIDCDLSGIEEMVEK